MITGTLEGWKKWILMTEAEQKKFAKECEKEWSKKRNGK